MKIALTWVRPWGVGVNPAGVSVVAHTCVDGEGGGHFSEQPYLAKRTPQMLHPFGRRTRTFLSSKKFVIVDTDIQHCAIICFVWLYQLAFPVYIISRVYCLPLLFITFLFIAYLVFVHKVFTILTRLQMPEVAPLGSLDRMISSCRL